jgi:serine/threonine protein kinase
VGVVLPQPIQFGKYSLFERIGRGGMADVFKGRVQGPAGFERVFVVKRILPHLSDDPQFTKMFIEEAKLSARLNHPNIVQVFELGAVDKEYFIAMEYVKGRDLAETMRTLWARVGPPRPELVSYIGREMCRALAYAHDHTADDGSPVGMIHRDVSPSNVMLSYEGAVKILDFGIAKALGGKDAPEESNTQRGTLKGKFAYMAPEQTQGNEVDKRIDIFATGIVLHEVLTGRRLFKGENDLQTVERVRQCEVPPPSLQNPLCPPELDAIVLKALSRNREDRFQTAADMADALDDVVHAARFQPGHLAGLMRELFPTDAGGHAQNTSASGRVSSSLSGSQSRPHSAGMRSPTVPPIALSRSTASGRALPTPAPGMAEQALRKKPFLARGSTWAGLALAAAGIVVGVVASHSTATQVSMQGTAETKPLVRAVSISVSSIPVGADIYKVGDDSKRIGQTDTILDFELREDARISLVFRKEGYQEEVREVSPYPIMVLLKPAPPPGMGRGGGRHAPSPPPPPPAPPPAPAQAPAGGAEPVRVPAATHERAHGRSSSEGSGRRPSEIVDPFSK